MFAGAALGMAAHLIFPLIPEAVAVATSPASVRRTAWAACTTTIARGFAQHPVAQRSGHSPVLGRFLSADTIVPSPNDPQSLNRFSYTRNNPLKYIDPSGHMEAMDVVYAIGAAVSTAAYYAAPVIKVGMVVGGIGYHGAASV